MSRRRQLYEGKAKILYEGPEPGTIIQYFKDDATAFNAQKKGTINGKGVINNRISEHVFLRLAHIGIPTHFIRRLNMREQLVRQVEIIRSRSWCATSPPVRSQAPRPRGRRAAAAHADRVLPQERRTAGPDGRRGAYRLPSAGPTTRRCRTSPPMAIRVNDFMCGMFAGDRHPPDRLQARVRPHLGPGQLQPGDPRRRDQPRQLPRCAGHVDRREARQGPLPPRSRRRGGGATRKSPAARPAATARTRVPARCSTSRRTARSCGPHQAGEVASREGSEGP